MPKTRETVFFCKKNGNSGNDNGNTLLVCLSNNTVMRKKYYGKHK